MISPQLSDPLNSPVTGGSGFPIVRRFRLGIRTLAASLVASAISQGAIIAEIEGNNTLATAQNFSGSFTTGANADIGSQFGINPESTPWVSITSSGGDNFDFYSFTTYFTGDISIDIDYGFYIGGSVDTEIALWRNNGDGTFLLLGYNDDGNLEQDGTIDFDLLDPGSVAILDPGLRFKDLAAGDYVVGVGPFDLAFSDGGIEGTPFNDEDTYTLQVTAAGASIAAIPEPGSTLALGGLLLGGLLWRIRRQA